MTMVDTRREEKTGKPLGIVVVMPAYNAVKTLEMT